MLMLFKKGQIPWNKDKKMSVEFCKKCKQRQTGIKPSMETKEKMRRAHKGYIPWNKDMKGYINKGSFRGGDIPWIKGKKHTETTRKKISIICKKNTKRGRAHYRWKGTSSLYEQIRKLSEYKQWRLDVFHRDNFTCQCCDSNKSGTLNAHHKISFSILLSRFLKKYDQFSPIEDKEILVRLATKYKPFWERDNGVVLCEKCHRLTPNYLKRKE